MSFSLEDDPRWRRLHDSEWVCPHCNCVHNGLFDLGVDRPIVWSDPGDALPNSAITESDHVLTEDFCILQGQNFFVRGVAYLPIIGAQDSFFGLGVWSSLSKANFDLYVSQFDDGGSEDSGPWFGWFSNNLKGYPDAFRLKCNVHPQSGGRRPHIELEETDHPLSVEQRQGITFDRILDLYALNGHDVREALTPRRS